MWSHSVGIECRVIRRVELYSVVSTYRKCPIRIGVNLVTLKKWFKAAQIGFCFFLIFSSLASALFSFSYFSLYESVIE